MQSRNINIEGYMSYHFICNHCIIFLIINNIKQQITLRKIFFIRIICNLFLRFSFDINTPLTQREIEIKKAT